ncbi:MAG: gliding motility lipoprotein GldD [Cytophagaceae bacterium]
MKRFPLWLSLIFLTCACTEDFSPKPKGYNRIDLPPHEYQQLTEKHPYTFEYSKSATIQPHKSAATEPHWIDIVYPDLHASVEITYKPIKKKQALLDEFLDDSHKLTSKHNIKATAIDQSISVTPHGYTAMIFELSGEVPSQFQFYVTDSTSNFLRGALYFPTATKNDSLSPVIEYIKLDMMHLINTVEWIKPN